METTTTKLSESQTKEINNFIQQWEKFANAYFWNPPTNANQRRAYEKYNSMDLSIEIDGVKYTGKIKIDCSCKNIYVRRGFYVNGAKKRITALKALLK